MKTNKKKLLVSVLTLVVALALATTTTYAWFTMNERVTVSQIDMTVTADNGIWISTTGNDGTWGTSVSLADMTGTLEALTTTAGNTLAFQRLITSNRPSGATVSGTASGAAYAAASGFYTADLYFQSNIARTITLETASVVSSRRGINAPTDFLPVWNGIDDASTFSGAVKTVSGSKVLKYAKAGNALRIAFTVDGAATGGKFILATHEDVTGDYFDYGTVNSVNAAHKYYESVMGVVPSVTTAPTVTGYTNVTAENCSQVTFTTAKITDRTEDERNSGTDTADIYEAHITIHIWLEGTDADCFDYLLQDALGLSLSFVSVK